MGNEASCMEGDWRELGAGPIFRAVHSLDEAALEEILTDEKLRGHIDDLDGDGFGALHCVAYNGKASLEQVQAIIKHFIKAGGDINLRNKFRETPLMLAACYGNYEPAKALIEAGALLNSADRNGKTALILARNCFEKSQDKEKCEKTLKLVEAAVLRDMQGNPAMKRANILRQLGNELYQKGDFDEAAEFYTKSIQEWEDPRAYGNRSAAYLKSAVHRLVNGVPGFRIRFRFASDDASKAVGMDATYEKGHFRNAKGYIGYRDLPRAKRACREGLKHCPDSKALADLHEELHKLGVPDHFSNPFSVAHADIVRKLESGWMGEARCPWCDLVVLNYPIPQECPFCTCDPSEEVDQDAIDELTIF